MNYEVLRTTTAEEQIREIVFYLTDLAGNPEPALRFLDELEHAASTLSAFPRSGMVPPADSASRRV